MGAGQSKPDKDEQGAINDVPIQFSQDVVNHLADTAAAPMPSPGRQSSIDAQIRARIHSELSRLQQEEEEIRREIELSLEKENLDQEAKGLGPVGDGDGGDDTPEAESYKTLNSNVLLGDLEEVRQKVKKFRSRQEEIEQHPAGQAARALASCYAENASKPLECWKEVAAFKSSVAQLEQDYVSSFR